MKSPAVGAWILVAVLVAIALLTVTPPATMLLVQLVVLTSEAGPLFALLTAIGAIVVLAVTRRGVDKRQRIAMLSLLVLAVALEVRPLVLSHGYNLSYAIRGDGNATPLTERRIRYTAADGSPLDLLLIRGPTPGAHPTLIVVYGGAWRGGEPTQALDVSRYFARRGYTIVAVDYRHAPAHQYPAQIDDVRRSLAVARDSAVAWGIDTSRVALVGRSAGGHLALLAAYAQPPALPVRAVAAFYAPFDLAEAYADPPHPDPIDVRHILRQFLGGSPADVPAQFRAASPSSYMRGGLPRTLLVYAGHDHLVQPKFGREAAAALRARGNSVTYIELPWAEHGFDLLPNGVGSQYAIWLLEPFLADALRRPGN